MQPQQLVLRSRCCAGGPGTGGQNGDDGNSNKFKKALVPIIAAILILGALALFLGMYLNGANKDNGKEIAEKQSKQIVTLRKS